WARLLEIRDEAALLSALAYALSPRLIAHLGAGHLDLVYALAWWPWLMGSVKNLTLSPSPYIERDLRDSLSPSLRRVGSEVISVAIFASLLFLGDVRLSLFALALAAAYGLWEMIRLKRLQIGIRFF